MVAGQVWVAPGPVLVPHVRRAIITRRSGLRIVGPAYRTLGILTGASRPCGGRGMGWLAPIESQKSVTDRDCLRLSRELPHIEHKFLVLGMANAWILLAEMAERGAAG